MEVNMDAKADKGSSSLVKAHWEKVVIVIALLFMLGFKYVPPFEGLTPLAMEILGVFIGAMIFWLAISISWPSILVMVALMLSPLYSFGQVISMSIGTWVVSFVLFTTALCYVLRQVGFFKRLAIWFLTRKIVSRSAWAFITMLSISSIIVGSFMSQLTIFLIFVPIVIAVFDELGYEKGDRVPMLIVICLLLFTTYANFTTPIAKVMPVMAMTLYTRFTGGLEISFVQYMAVGIPMTIVIFIVVMLFLRLTFKADFSKMENLDTEFLRRDIGPMGRKERICAIVFFCVVFLWLAPGVFQQFGLFPKFAALVASLGAPTPPMLGIVALCLIQDEGKPIVEVDELLSKGVAWSVFLMVGATALLGDAITNSEVGITDWIGARLAPMLSTLPPIICVLLILTVAIIFTNFASDMVTVVLLCSISIPMILSGGLTGINPAALTYLIGQASTVGPATAVGSASAAIASGDGYLQPVPMFIWGMILSLLTGVLMTFLGYPLANLIMG
ncbi:MAG: SLC13 family permease [Coriobacteriia bacterium]|nr:SLC13 family permease [Coriobacteriia bacterium]